MVGKLRFIPLLLLSFQVWSGEHPHYLKFLGEHQLVLFLEVFVLLCHRLKEHPIHLETVEGFSVMCNCSAWNKSTLPTFYIPVYLSAQGFVLAQSKLPHHLDTVLSPSLNDPIKKSNLLLYIIDLEFPWKVPHSK